jgi:hypothetical protein
VQNRVKHIYICLSGEHLWKSHQDTTELKKFKYLQGDLMAIKKGNLSLHVFICEILANMTQVSDVAPGPLVFYMGQGY